MYIARTLKELNAAVSRDEHEIKMMGEAMKEYRKFLDRHIDAVVTGGIGGVSTGFLSGLVLGGPVGAGIGLVTGLAVGASTNKKQKKEENEHLEKNSCKGLRDKIKYYYKEISSGNSYIIITHK